MGDSERDGKPFEEIGPHRGAGQPPGEAPGLINRLAARILLDALEGLTRGRLEIELPDGSRRDFGDPAARPRAIVRVRRWAFFRKVLIGGGTGAGGSYIDGDWEADDLVRLVRLVVLNDLRLEDASAVARLGNLADRFAHWTRRNTQRGAKANIVAHYDLSNELYSTFLDETMTYSCAVFEDPGQSLAEAQRNKVRTIAAKAALRPGDRVLEIGCGWGGFMEYAAGVLGCRVTGITLSPEQADFARRRLASAGLADRTVIELVDYRAAQGRYDKIVSIEMAEAVGHEYLPAYFGAIDRLLEPDGLAVIQVITLPDERYEAYLRNVDYTQKYIFPGSHLPSLGAMTAALSRTRLMIEDVENIAPHYAETLRRWRTRFLSRLDVVRELGFDGAFVRRWEFYLAFCEGAFAARYLSDLQIVLTRAGNRALPTAPYAGDAT